MGCSLSSVPPLYFKNKGGWCPCIICIDHSYTRRHEILFNQLRGIADLVNLVESFIPLDCSHIPSWYLYGGKKEFYHSKPRAMFGPVVWNYYVQTQHKGVAFYAITKEIYQDSIWINETRLKLQILNFHFKPTSHPNCLKGFRAILKNETVSAAQLTLMSNHLNFWIKKFNFMVNDISTANLELTGFYPLVWILLTFLLRSENVLLSKKSKIVKFLVEDMSFCLSIRDTWTNLAGEFLEALSSPSLLRYKTFMKTVTASLDENSVPSWR